ncbi:TPA: hypothetical protein ACH3X3_009896 [Trebouxia sp. C0006]
MEQLLPQPMPVLVRDKTEAALALDTKLEQLRRELSLKQEEANQAAPEAAAWDGLSLFQALQLTTKLLCSSSSWSFSSSALMQ